MICFIQHPLSSIKHPVSSPAATGGISGEALHIQHPVSNIQYRASSIKKPQEKSHGFKVLVYCYVTIKKSFLMGDHLSKWWPIYRKCHRQNQ